ncbi:MAG TPA: hypothetical protein VED40_06230 [Azospirillaceae bacterium]|nr:hypothetical protein [Azospirillaceae bacterium]
MTQLTMEQINAYLDGALSDLERLRVETILARDPASAGLLTQYRTQIDALHRLYDPVLEEPVPEAMLELLRRRAARQG